MKHFIPTIIVVAMFSGFSATANAQQDRFEGAVWKFELEPATANTQPLQVLMRVSANGLYQRGGPGDAGLRHKMGKIRPNGKRAQFKVDNMRVYDANGQFVGQRSGIAKIKLHSYGNWSGIFTNKQGRKWVVRCTRIRE